jgi:PhnB protein
MQIQPYLFFDGRAEEAIEFYKTAIGAKVEALMRWKDSPDKSMATPTNADKVMHSAIRIGDTTVLASDGRNTGNPNFQGFALTINAKDEAEADKLFAALGVVPPEKLVFINSFSDKNGGITRHPMSPTWPLEMLSVFTFEDLGAKTKFTIRWSADNAPEEERKTFDSSHEGMRQGWGGTMEQLEVYLASAK